MLLFKFLQLAVLALAAPIPQTTTPAVYTPSGYTTTVASRAKSVTYIANVTDPSLNRDSCGSTLVSGRILWTCRDTQAFNVTSGLPQQLPVMTNSASWTNLSAYGGPDLEPGPVGAGSDGVRSILQMYGGDALQLPAYFAVQKTQCPGTGACTDNTRYVVWQDQPPLITQQNANGSAVGYTWIPNQQLEGMNNCITNNPFYYLYKQTYTPSTDANALPTVEVISPAFYATNDIGYGRYGSMMHNGTAYLYGQTSEKQTVLARVSADQIENRTAYEYYQTSTQNWLATAPLFNISSAATAPTYGAAVANTDLLNSTQSTYVIPNAGYGGQGTFYYSSYLSSFVWTGQSIGLDGSSANFYITTAPSPEGPWTEPTLLFSGENGDHPVAGGYTLQAHPALLPSGPQVASESGIYVSWTQQWADGMYITPLVWIEFE